MKRMIRFLAFIMVVQIGFAQRTVPLNLEQLVQYAGAIVDVTVVKTETGKDPESGLLVTWVTTDVNETFYGVQGKRFTFKQYGGEADGIANYPAHLPKYAAGERTLLFLTGPSTIGMQSPVGMQQGKFLLVKEGTVKTRLKNIVKNPSLLKGISPELQAAKNIRTYNDSDGSLEYDEFAQLVRSFVQSIKQ